MSRGDAMTIAIVYIGLCFIIAFIGTNRKFGFWGYLFCSLAFTPCVGIIALLASSRRPQPPKEDPQSSSALSETRTKK
jgi:hypothetical protein